MNLISYLKADGLPSITWKKSHWFLCCNRCRESISQSQCRRTLLFIFWTQVQSNLPTNHLIEFIQVIHCSIQVVQVDCGTLPFVFSHFFSMGCKPPKVGTWSAVFRLSTKRIFLHLNYRPTHPLLDSAAPAARIHLLPGRSSSRSKDKLCLIGCDSQVADKY